MKLKSNNLKLTASAIIIAGSILSGATFAYLNLTQPNNHNEHSAFAAVGRQIEATGTATITPVADSQSFSYNIKNMTIDMKISDSQDINDGDYTEFKFKNINAKEDIFNDREVRIDDEIIGKFKLVNGSEWIEDGSSREKTQPGVGSAEYTYQLVFNKKMNNYKNRSFRIESENMFNYLRTTTVDYSMTASVELNGNVIGSRTVAVKGVPAREPRQNVSVATGEIRLYTNDGETITGERLLQTAYNTYKNDSNGFRAGDIITHTLPSDSGFAFDYKVGVSGAFNDSNNTYTDTYHYINPNGVIYSDGGHITFDVIEASPHRVKLRIKEATPGYVGNSAIPIKIIDTSPKTIDYDNSKLVEFQSDTTVTRGDELVYSRKNNHTGNVRGAKLKAYADIKKRGSVIVKIQDENGNKIYGFESDSLLIDRLVEGTDYRAQKPEIAGYTFVSVSQNSAPEKGKVVEGVKNVILVYKIATKDQTVKIGETLDPKNNIPDFEKNFPNCTASWKQTPDASKAGKVSAVVVISCPNQPDREVEVNVIVEEEAKEVKFEAPDTGSNGKNYLFEILTGGILLTIISAFIFKKKF